MCGLIGFYSPIRLDAAAEIGWNMANAVTHRGPDDLDVWVDDALCLTLGHRRLSILDLSAAGRQPMLSACKRYVLAFNGEIYNHLELRTRLTRDGEAPPWRGHSDTETLLACFSAWGVKKTLQAAVGMFAIALWNRQTRMLTLARDRLGEKPLYWGWQDGSLLFASELKALKAHPGFKAEVDRNAVVLLLRHGYVDAPHSIYKDIRKLQPGHFVDISLSDMAVARAACPTAYWRLNDVARAGLDQPFKGTPAQAVEELERQLTESVRAQMLADVPLGAFLSGGIDSSTIVALMQTQSPRPVRTFTIGFTEDKYNEAQYARAVAEHIGTQHTDLYVQADDALALIPRLPEVYDEPFADSSQIPTYLVSRLARQHVAIALSGDAGDELFGGYDTYRFVPSVWNRIGRIPAPLRSSAAFALKSLPPPAWNMMFSRIRSLVPNKLNGAITGEKVHKLAELLACTGKESFYHQLSSHWKDPERIVIASKEPRTIHNTVNAWPKTDTFEHWMMAVGAQTYMTDDILVKVDRAAMSNSLEVRIPMLDHRVVELAWRMPIGLKIRDGTGKWLLREVLYRHIPKELVDRPKMGFTIPLADWLRGPLRTWAEALLDEARILREGFFHPAPIRASWADHICGRRDHSAKLWCVLMFQAWLERESQPRAQFSNANTTHHHRPE